jgi:hypothetical protein
MFGFHLFFAAIAGIHIWRNKHPNERWKLRILLDLPGICFVIYICAASITDLVFHMKEIPLVPAIIMIVATTPLMPIYLVDMFIAKSKSNYKKLVGKPDLTDGFPV